MKKLILFLLLPILAICQTTTGQEQEFDYGIKNNSTQTITTPPYLTTTGMDGTQGKIPSALIEKTDNKQNSLAVDGTGTKYPTVDAVNTGLALKANDSDVVKLTGNQTISGQKSFSLTGKIDMQTNNAFPAIRVTALGSNGQSAAEFINSSSFPNSTALRLQTSSSGGAGNRALDVSNQSSIGTGIFSNASNGGVSISSQSGNGDSYISNITLGGTGRNYVGRNNGTETYSVDKIGNIIGNSYIKRSTPATNILLAGGGDIAQNTAFNKNFGTTAGTVVEGGTLGSNAYSSTAYLPLSGGEIIGSIRSMATEPIAGKVTDNTPYRMYEDGVNVKYGIGLSSSGGINYMSNQAAAITSHRFYGGRDNDNPKLLLSIEGDGNTTVTGTVKATNFNGSATLTGTPTAPTAAVGTNTAQIATMEALQAHSSSGTYTPTLTNTANITSSTLNAAYYVRNGNLVTVTIAVQTTIATTGAETVLTFSLPVSGATAVNGIGQGNITSGGGAINGFGIVDITNYTTGQLRIGKPDGSGAGITNIIFTYSL